jgi:regulator of protease activity HflC (stomatin/prohibitin superfamily)/predicted outer membrane lipoprotein
VVRQSNPHPSYRQPEKPGRQEPRVEKSRLLIKSTLKGTAPMPGPSRPRTSLIIAVVFIGVALVLQALAGRQVAPPAVLFDSAAAFLIAGCGFMAAALAMRTRRIESTGRLTPDGDAHSRTPSVTKRWRAAISRVVTPLPEPDWSSEGAAIFGCSVLCWLAISDLVKAWQPAVVTPSAAAGAWLTGLLLAAAFPILVLERQLTDTGAERLPEASALARLLRVPMLALVALSLASGLSWLGLPAPIPWIERGIAVAIGLVAGEIIVRGLLRAFVPASHPSTRRGHVDSEIAGLIQLRWPDIHILGQSIRRQFGIDLERSWALGFIRRASFPVLIGVILFSWLLTGVTAIGASERAVYEALGTPVAVLHPGLHLHLPWPFGLLRRVDFGGVHEIPIVFDTDAAAPAESQAGAPATPAGIEDEAPAGADRLWDASHPSEASYLVASNSNGRQNFEVINIDLRVLYRIGLSDRAARDATYNVASPEAIIQAAAGRMLARYFARFTVLDVLGQNREAFIQGFQRELQARLSDLSTGVEVMGIIVEAIHPPPAAAPAYQGVQTAEIRSLVRIASARAEAAGTLSAAQTAATTVRDQALAAAAERVDGAKAELALFSGDRQAYLVGGRSFLLERRLQHFDKALRSTPLVIIDHRINKPDAPTLDLRPSLSMDAPIPEEVQ